RVQSALNTPQFQKLLVDFVEARNDRVNRVTAPPEKSAIPWRFRALLWVRRKVIEPLRRRVSAYLVPSTEPQPFARPPLARQPIKPSDPLCGLPDAALEVLFRAR